MKQTERWSNVFAGGKKNDGKIFGVSGENKYLCRGNEHNKVDFLFICRFYHCY